MNSLSASSTLVLIDGDIGRPETGEAPVSTAVREFGSVDLLVNNAGILISKPFTEYATGDFEKLISTNLAGFFYASQAVVRQMQRQQSGHIVNISTTLADHPMGEFPSQFPFSPKAGGTS